jgi:hypothetical protein
MCGGDVGLVSTSVARDLAKRAVKNRCTKTILLWMFNRGRK